MKNLKIILAAIFTIAFSSIHGQITGFDLNKPYKLINEIFANGTSNGLITKCRGFIMNSKVYSHKDGNVLECHKSEDYAEEFWNIKNVGNDYYTITNNSANLSIDNLGSSENSAELVNKIPNGSDSQQWKFISIGVNLYKIVNKVSGLSLTRGVDNNSNSVTQKTFTGDVNQKWKLVINNNDADMILSQPKNSISSLYPTPVIDK
jgi:Ricin-type beta-trefoil lectin domain-like